MVNRMASESVHTKALRTRLRALDPRLNVDKAHEMRFRPAEKKVKIRMMFEPILICISSPSSLPDPDTFIAASDPGPPASLRT